MINISRKYWVEMGIIAERIKNFLKPQNLGLKQQKKEKTAREKTGEEKQL